MRWLCRPVLAGLLALPLLALPAAPPAVAAAATFNLQAGGGTPDGAVQAFLFSPTVITIDEGDSITWGASGEPHTVSFGAPPFSPGSDQVFAPAGGAGFDGSGFASAGLLLPGQSYTLNFSKAGTYAYRCLLHQPAMKATVVVQPAGTAYPVAPAAYQPASDPQLASAIQSGAAALAGRQVTAKPNGDGTTTYRLDAGAGDGKSFGLLRFGADSLAIHTGDSVVWTQPDPSEVHTVTFLNDGQDVPFVIQKPDGSLGANPHAAAPAGGKVYDGSGYFNAGILLPTKSYALTFSKVGVYHYRCLIHDDEGMLATVTVLAPGDASAASAPVALGGSVSGTLAGNAGGAFGYYNINNPSGSALTLKLSYGPFDGGQAHAVGLNVYQNGQKLGGAHGQTTGLGDAVNSSTPSVTVTPSASGGPLLIQVFNYGSDTVSYTLTVS